MTVPGDPGSQRPDEPSTGKRSTPVSILDEQVLSERLHRQLHADLGALPAPPAPVGAVRRRGRAIRARRWAAAGSGLMAGAAAVAIAVSVQTGGPAARPAAARPAAARTAAAASPAGSQSPAGILNSATPPGGSVFAAGVAGGAAWQLSVRNIAGNGSGCLPAVLLNGTDGDLLSAPPATPAGLTDIAFLDNLPGGSGAGYAALQVAPGVTRLTAIFRNGTRLGLHPVTVHVCGREMHLAGFAYPASGVAQITASSGGQLAATSQETPPASLFRGADDTGGHAASSPGLRLVPGVWEHVGATPAVAATGTAGSGRLGTARWGVTVTLGPAGECFAGASFGGGPYTSSSACVPIGLPPATAALHPVVLTAQPRVVAYAGLVNARTATVVATLSDGTSRRIRPVTIAGRRYLALAVPAGATLTRVTLRDAAGHAFATVTVIPPAG